MLINNDNINNYVDNVELLLNQFELIRLHLF